MVPQGAQALSLGTRGTGCCRRAAVAALLVVVCGAEGLDGQAARSNRASAAGGAAEAVAGWLPEIRYFPSPLADPREPRLAGGFLRTDLFSVRATPPAERPAFDFQEPREDLEGDVQATVALGGTLPLWGVVVDREVAVMVGAQLAIFNRFRMERASRDDVGGDWVVAVPLEFRVGDGVAGRVRLSHRSAHLGDEVAMRGDIQRLEFSYESLDLLVAARPVPEVRVYGGGTVILNSNTFRVERSGDPREPLLIRDFGDRFVFQGGLELEGTRATGVAPVAAADLQWAERTGFRTQVSALAGLSGVVHDMRGRLVLRYLYGPSHMGEFFLTQERALGIELVLEL